jgi:hypothetical protein
VTASLLPIPDAPRFPGLFNQWEVGWYLGWQHPRSQWLRDFEALLREFYPSANRVDRLSDDVAWLARQVAKLASRDGPNVP